MSTLNILLNQIGMFVIYILAGIILIQTHVLNRENMEVVSRLVIKLALPVMIFTNTVNGVDKQMLFHSLPILGIAFFMYICLFGLSFLSGKILHLQGDHQQLYSAMSAFGNIGFMGIPIVTSIFPERGMLYISVFSRGKANLEGSGYSGNYLKKIIKMWKKYWCCKAFCI